MMMTSTTITDHPRSGNNVSRVCMCVCLSSCLSDDNFGKPWRKKFIFAHPAYISSFNLIISIVVAAVVVVFLFPSELLLLVYYLCQGGYVLVSVCLSFWLSVSNYWSHLYFLCYIVFVCWCHGLRLPDLNKETTYLLTYLILIEILPEIIVWIRKNWLNFGSRPSLDPELGIFWRIFQHCEIRYFSTIWFIPLEKNYTFLFTIKIFQSYHNKCTAAFLWFTV